MNHSDGRLMSLLLLGAITFLGARTPVCAQQSEDPCLMCHTNRALFQTKEDPDRLVVTPEQLAGSVHESLGESCILCHQGMPFPHPEGPVQVSCSPCHADLEEEFANSLHGYAAARGNPRAPTCASCHGGHDILPSEDPASPTHKVRVVSTCAACHGEEGLLTDQLVRLPQSFTSYAESVHGRGNARGVAAAASCADCHSVHDLRSSADPQSKIHPQNVAATCGQCHPDIQLDYEGSIHGRALAAGVLDSPTCTGCHGEHLILSPEDPEAQTCGVNQARQTCGGCHDDPLIISKYNLQDGVVDSYLDSYHGWTSRRGCEATATCVSCHSAHQVLPAEDPESMVHADNVVETCGQCHENGDLRFAKSYDHRAASLTRNPVNRIIRIIYLVLIVGIIGGMVLHNLVIMNYYLVKRRWEEEANGDTQIVRFNRSQIVQHLLLTLSFVLLVITGFALRYPEAWWVDGLALLGMTETIRGDLHRIAAVVLVATSLLHIHYLFFTSRGKRELRALLPTLRDVEDLVDNIRFHTWQTDREVRFGQYDYSQKAEYWALVWGTIIMILTGLVLWFPALSVRIFPAVVVPASQTIHFYEAILATLAIVVWHFFFVIFHPEEYPMSWTWLTGKMSRQAVKRHHARWWDEGLSPSGGGAGEDLGPRARAAAFTQDVDRSRDSDSPEGLD